MRRFAIVVVLFVGSLAGALGAQDTPSFHLNLVNTGRHTISAFQASPTKSADWGANLLSNPLGPKQQATVTIAGDCGQFDIRFVAEKGTRLHDDDVSLCDGDSLTIGDRTVKKNE